MHKILAIILLIFLFSNHLESGTNSIANKADTAIGIKNPLAKYSPLITKNEKKRTEMLFDREGEAANIVSGFQ